MKVTGPAQSGLSQPA